MGIGFKQFCLESDVVFEGNYVQECMNISIPNEKERIPNEKERKICEFKMDLLEF